MVQNGGVGVGAEGGSGDVVGPAISKDNAVARYDGTTGKLIQDSTNGPTASDSGDLGVGVSSPSLRLDVEKSADSEWVARMKNTSSTTPNGLLVDLPSYAGTNSYAFGINTSGSYKHYIRPDGKIYSSELTASRALTIDSNGFFTSSSVTDTELGYLSGTTSAVQTQLDKRQYSLHPPFAWTEFSGVGTDFTVGTAYYYYYEVAEDVSMNGASVFVNVHYGVDTVYELGLFYYADSGNFNKIQSAQVTSTGTGWWDVTFSATASLTRSQRRYFLGFLQVSGTARPATKTSATSSSKLGITGSTSLSALPSTETTRSATNIVPLLGVY